MLEIMSKGVDKCSCQYFAKEKGVGIAQLVESAIEKLGAVLM